MSFVATVVAAFALASSAGLAIHDPGLSSLQVRHGDGQLLAHVAFANADFRAATTLDRDGDGSIDAEELARADAALHELVRTSFLLRTATGDTTPTLLGAAIAENRDVELSLAFALPPAAATLHVEFLTRLSRGHRCYTALLRGDDVVADALLNPNARTFAVPAATAAATTATGFAQAGAFFVLGIEHILIGFDHLAFLLALLVGGLSWRRVVATITAFTVAHSVTLIGAATGWLVLPSQLVEATIAASIVVVAIANLRQHSAATHRWPFAFGFGLVHGFGFASVLADFEVGGPDMLTPLLTFNLGVEVGQLAFAAAVVPLLALAARHFRSRRVAIAVSIAVGLAGCWWLQERLFA